MNYLRQILAFEALMQQRALPALAQVLWYKLMHLANSTGWAEWVCVENRRLMLLLGAYDEKTLARHRQALIDFGLIEYRRGHKGAPSRYRLVRLYAAKGGENSRGILPAKAPGQSPALSKPSSISETIEGFTPPQLCEVQEYCAQRNSCVDAATFVDFYAAKGWRVGRQPMRDWKAAVRTWERRAGLGTTAQRQNPARAYAQRQYTDAQLEEMFFGRPRGDAG